MLFLHKNHPLKKEISIPKDVEQELVHPHHQGRVLVVRKKRVHKEEKKAGKGGGRGEM